MTNLPYMMETYGINDTPTVTGTITTTTAVTSDGQGWQCPVCKRIYAPWKGQCLHCPAANYQWVYTSPYKPSYPVYWGSTWLR